MNKRIALITGGGSGIGFAVSKTLATSGFVVVLSGRNKDTLANAKSEIEANGGEAITYAGDMSDPSAVTGLFELVDSQLGRLDLLFNNAGILPKMTNFEDLLFEDWQNTFNSNLNTAFLCAQGAFRLMKAQVPKGGRIINNGSVSASTPRPLAVGYTSTKHALTGLTKSIALEGRAHDIACGQIDIGNASTDMTETMQTGILQPNGLYAVEHVMNVKQVADAVLCMANMPLDANVLSMTLIATKMPLIGRG